MYHACGNSLICDTLDVARYVCYDKGQDVKGMAPSCPRIDEQSQS